MTRSYRFGPGWVVMALLLAGCQHGNRGPGQHAGRVGLTTGDEKTPNLTARQTADVHFAMGRSLEKRGETAQAAATYQQVIQKDPKRADAHLRLAILYDQQGKFKESGELYQKALQLKPGDADTYNSVGYSMYLQSRWSEAEMNLRQALAINPDHSRAHNNLGLVLAHAGRADEAFAEFRKAGCDEADAHSNLAFVLTLERSWPEAREHYEKALAVNPSSTHAKKGLQEVNSLIAKAEGIPGTYSAGGAVPASNSIRMVGSWESSNGDAATPANRKP